MLVEDPVCGMTVDPDNSKGGSAQHAGVTYHFWSASCREKFVGDPRRVVQPWPHAVAPPVPLGATPVVARTVQHTCPMHPEIVRNAPGSCPICGMALEPRTVTAEEEENPELLDMTRRFWVGLVLTVPVFVLAMGEMIPGGPLQRVLAPAVQPWAELVLATPVVLWAGWPFFVRMWASFINRSPNMFTLIGIGTGAAYGYSVAATIFPSWFPPSFRGHHGQIDRYFEAGHGCNRQRHRRIRDARGTRRRRHASRPARPNGRRSPASLPSSARTASPKARS